MTREEIFTSMQELVDAGLIHARYNALTDGWRVSVLDPATGGLASPETADLLQAAALRRLSQLTERN